MNKVKAKILQCIGELTEEEIYENNELSAESDLLTKSMEAEAQLLQAFIEMIRRMKDLSWMLKPTAHSYDPSYGRDNIKDLMSSKVVTAVTRQKLKKIIDEKMPILQKVIEDIFGKEDEEHHEEHEKHEEDDEECEDCE